MESMCSEEGSWLLLPGVPLAIYVPGAVLRHRMTIFSCKAEAVIDLKSQERTLLSILKLLLAFKMV